MHWTRPISTAPKVSMFEKGEQDLSTFLSTDFSIVFEKPKNSVVNKAYFPVPNTQAKPWDVWNLDLERRLPIDIDCDFIYLPGQRTVFVSSLRCEGQLNVTNCGYEASMHGVVTSEATSTASTSGRSTSTAPTVTGGQVAAVLGTSRLTGSVDPLTSRRSSRLKIFKRIGLIRVKLGEYSLE